jgi:hypothetical protein
MDHVSDRRWKRSNTSPVSHACAAVCEQLEARELLSTITWVNRGFTASGPLPDRFDTVFGSLANQARSVVDAALAAWARTITGLQLWQWHE